MTGHQWVKFQYTPVKVSVPIPDTIEIVIDEGQRRLADEDAKFGCWTCDAPLNVFTINSECIPEVAQGQIATGP